MYNVYQLALRAESYEPGLTRQPYSKLTIVVGEDAEGNDVSYRAIAYGDTARAPASDAEYRNLNGEELVIHNPNGTQQMAINVMKQIKGYAYQPYSARNALVPIDAELGDVVRIAGDQSIIATQDFVFDGLAASDISAPGADETDNEFSLYESRSDKARVRSEKALKASLIVELGRIEANLEENYQTKEDMTNYVLAGSLNASIGAYIDSSAGTAKVVNAASGTYQRKDQMGDYVQTSALNTSISQYLDSQAGTAQIISAASGTYQTKAGMSSYVAKSSLNTSIGQYIDSSTGKAKIVSAVSGTYQTISGMSSYVTKSSLDASITAHINTQAGIAEVTSAVSATYQRKDAMGNYVLNNTLNNKIGQYIDSTDGTNKIVASVSGKFAGKSYESKVELAESKLSWLIRSGTSASNFTMTDRAVQLTAGSIDLSGYVTITSLGTAGATTINGSNIVTGRISANVIDTDNLKVQTVYGYYDPEESWSNQVILKADRSGDISIGSYSINGTPKYTDLGITVYNGVTISNGSGTTKRRIYFDLVNGAVTPSFGNNSALTKWSLGTSNNPFSSVEALSVSVKSLSFRTSNYSYSGDATLTASDGSYGVTDLVPSTSPTSLAIGTSSNRLRAVYASDIDTASAHIGTLPDSVIYIGSSSSSIRSYIYIGGSNDAKTYVGDGHSASVSIGNSETGSFASKLGFFGATPIVKQTLSTSSANMGYTSATASNYLVILNNVVGILSKKYGIFAS